MTGTHMTTVEQIEDMGVGIFSVSHLIAESKPMVEPPPKPKPKLGRPKKRDESYYREIWEFFCSMEDWFIATYQRKQKSVAELLESYYIDTFLNRGLRVMRVNSPEVRGRMHTLENEISKAKKHQFPRH